MKTFSTFFKQHQEKIFAMGIIVIVILMSLTLYAWFILLKVSIQSDDSNFGGVDMIIDSGREEFVREKISPEREAEFLEELDIGMPDPRESLDAEEREEIKSEVASPPIQIKPPIQDEKTTKLLDALSQ